MMIWIKEAKERVIISKSHPRTYKEEGRTSLERTTDDKMETECRERETKTDHWHPPSIGYLISRCRGKLLPKPFIIE